MNKNLFIFLQHTLPQHLYSRIMGRAADCRTTWLKNYMISRFIQRYKVDMSIASSDQLDAYPTFNTFFTRALKRNARPIATEHDIVVSPVDGCVSQIGKIEHDTLLQAKGSYFNVGDLLGTKGIPSFANGHYATFYLSPKDYHRVHMPLDGKLTHTIYIPGKLYSVNLTATENIPGLFAHNERLVCLFDTAMGPMAVILIGAMLVGKIQTIWGLIERSKNIVTRRYSDGENICLSKGDELGRFLMGSSVIVLFGQEKIQWLPDLQGQSLVQMGQAVGAGTKK